jgi:hypothetical protein
LHDVIAYKGSANNDVDETEGCRNRLGRGNQRLRLRRSENLIAPAESGGAYPVRSSGSNFRLGPGAQHSWTFSWRAVLLLNADENRICFSKKQNLLFLKKKKQKDFYAWCCPTMRTQAAA